MRDRQISAELRYHDQVSTYHVQNFGCRATQADGAAIEGQFQLRGLVPAPADQADLIILNTCTVTNSADQDARAAVRRIQRQNPLARIIVTGCYAQRAPEEVAALPGVNAVIGNSHKHQLGDLVLGENLQRAKTFFPSVRLPRIGNCAPRTRFSSPTSSPTPNFSPRRFSNPLATSVVMHTTARDQISRSRTDAITAARFA